MGGGGGAMGAPVVNEGIMVLVGKVNGKFRKNFHESPPFSIVEVGLLQVLRGMHSTLHNDAFIDSATDTFYK